MKVIFLDVDGVLVTYRSHYAYNPKPDDKRFSCGLMQEFDRTAAAFLVKLCKNYNIKIVVSSTWRVHKDMIDKLLLDTDLKQFLHRDWRTEESDQRRGYQIRNWLALHPEVKKNDYRILDDDNDMLEEQQRQFVQCSMWDGISGQSFKALIEWGSGKPEIII
jgi:hypothetical protein